MSDKANLAVNLQNQAENESNLQAAGSEVLAMLRDDPVLVRLFGGPQPNQSKGGNFILFLIYCRCLLTNLIRCRKTLRISSGMDEDNVE